IQRLHLEEDTAKSLHAENDDTLIDYNKSGVPLIEIVTYPDFESVEEVILFSKRLKQIVKYLDISDAEMQKGQMRFELNISVKPDSMPAGQLPDYKVEVKNIGSISVLEKVLNFEVQRQSELLDKAEKIKSQTRGLKGMSGETFFQRSKETADDYRYFPEPDIPPIHISDAQIQELANSIPELPHERKQRYMDVGLESEQADIFVDDRTKGDWFDELLKLDSQKELVKEAAKWVVGEISGRLEKLNKEIDQINLTQQDLLEIVQLLAQKKISGIGVKKLIEARLVEENNAKKSINDLVTELGLVQITDSSEVENFAKQAIEQNPKLVADFAKNPNVIKALVGQVMKLSQGKVNPRIAEEEIRKLLNN
ncbi:partial Aspartyl/glutamyl-tRNA(Asn/Gln) amidotransferase subunit B, partial [Patescibacteria group bacterium]